MLKFFQKLKENKIKKNIANLGKTNKIFFYLNIIKINKIIKNNNKKQNCDFRPLNNKKHFWI